MTYSTPELLLVGAAQNLVLATASFTGECFQDSPPLLFSDDPELW
jgi:hypothetical protein